MSTERESISWKSQEDPVKGLGISVAANVPYADCCGSPFPHMGNFCGAELLGAVPGGAGVAMGYRDELFQ